MGISSDRPPYTLQRNAASLNIQTLFMHTSHSCTTPNPRSLTPTQPTHVIPLILPDSLPTIDITSWSKGEQCLLLVQQKRLYLYTLCHCIRTHCGICKQVKRMRYRYDFKLFGEWRVNINASMDRGREGVRDLGLGVLGVWRMHK